jgi:DNA-binding FadR family transcriptional regulator
LTHGLLDTQIDASHIETLIQLQDALEELVVSLAARNCNGDSAAKIGIALSVLSQATTPREIFTAAWALDSEIARATENAVVINIYCGLIQALEQSMEWVSVGELDVEDTVRVHAEIAGAVMRNDEDAARESARRHSPVVAGA